MRKVNFLAVLLGWLLLSWSVSAQQVIFEEDFNNTQPGFIPTGWTLGDGGTMVHGGFPTAPDTTWCVTNSTVSYAGGNGNNSGNDLGDGNYLFIDSDAAGGGQTQNDTITSPSIDLSSYAGPISFNFKLFHLDYSFTNETLFVDVYDGTNWVGLDTITQTTGSWNNPHQAMYDITAYKSPSFMFRFRYENGSWSFYTAIDQISIITPYDYDLKVLSTYFDNKLLSCVGIDTVVMQLTNVGLQDATSFVVKYEVYDASMNMVASGVDTIAGPLVPGDTLVHKFSTGVALSSAGTYYIKAYTEWASDNYNINDTIMSSYELVIMSATDATPWLETFDNFGRAGNTNSSPDTLKNGWFRDPEKHEPYTWKVGISGQAYSNSTGPDVDHTSGSGNYMYTEASLPAQQGDVSILYSPCIDLSNITNPHLAWWYHLYGADIDSLSIEVSADGYNWQKVMGYKGQVQTAAADPWLSDTVDLMPYKGKKVRVRFVGIRGASYMGDMAIDDVSIFNKVFNNDLTVVAINPSQSNLCVGDTITVDVVVKNVGGTLVTSGSASVDVNIGGNTSTDPINKDLNPGDTDTLQYTYVPTAAGSVDFYAIINWVDDNYNLNDSLGITLYATEIQFTVVSDTDTVAQGDTVCFSFSFAGSDSIMWEVDTTGIGVLFAGGGKTDTFACVSITTMDIDTLVACATVYKNGCFEKVCDSVYVDKTVNVANVLSQTLKVYPNPVKDVINVSVYGSAYVTLYDIRGNAIYSGVVVNEGSIDVSNLSKGIYILQVRVGAEVKSLKIVKE